MMTPDRPVLANCHRSGDNQAMQSTTLHVSQKTFWFAASFCLVIGTTIFCWRLLQNTAASIKLFGVEITCDAAQKSVQTTKESLLTVRTRLNDAAEQDDIASIKELLPDLDAVLKTLGVAEAALKRQQQALYFGDVGYNDYGYDSYHPIPNLTPAKKTR